MATSGRNPAYYTRGGGVWICRKGSKWIMFRNANASTDTPYETLGMFATLTAAVNHYRNEVIPNEAN